MLSILFVVFFAIVLGVVLHSTNELGTNLGTFLMVTFVSRLLLHFVARNVPFFSHGLGSDAITYEYLAKWIAEEWTIRGISFMTAADNEFIAQTSLPPNIFAVIIYLNGGQAAPVACTAVVAISLCVTALNFCKLAMELGAQRRIATTMTIALFSSPALLFYTSDMYKDGLVLMFVLGATGSAIRVSRKFSLLHVVIGVLCLGSLWFVRFYLVVLAVLPIAVGYMGFGSKSFIRPTISVVVLGAILAIALRSQQGNELGHTMEGTFANATDKASLDSNALGGSGVVLGDGIGAMPLRIIYTLFSPFPWMGGSLGLQLGKIDTILFYFFVYRAWIAGKKLARKDAGTLASLLAFAIPCTIAYAFTMSNMGLILRQRLPIVVLVALLATLSWPTREEAKAAAARKKARLAAQPPEPKRRGPLSARPKPALATNPSKLPGEA